MNQRISYIDLASGIMIVWMVVYHALGTQFGNVCADFPYLTFFMPWFFYKSGMLFHTKDVCSLLKKDSRKFILTFVVWSLIGVLVDMACMYIDGSLGAWAWWKYDLHELIKKGSVPPNSVCWFLLTLFFVRQFANLLFRKIPPVVVVVVGAVVTYLFYAYEQKWMPWYLWNISSGLCFFSMGAWFHQHEDDYRYWLPCVIVYLTLISGLVCRFPAVDMYPNRLDAGIYALWFPSALCGIVTFNKFCQGVDFIMQKISQYYDWLHVNNLFFHIVARYAMDIYVMHFIIREVVVWGINLYYPAYLEYRYLIVIVLTMLILPPVIWLRGRMKCVRLI